MNKKIIFFDIDGTLLEEDTLTVPQSTLDALKKAQSNGHKCFVNTGRPRSTINTIITDIPFDGYICGCGTYIEYNNKILFHTQLNEELRKKVIHSSFDCHVEAVLEGINGAYFPKNTNNSQILSIKKIYEDSGFPVFTYDYDDDIQFDKYAAWYDENSDIETYRQIISKDFDIIQRDTYFIEVVPLEYSKATGIQYIIDYLHSNIRNTISIGDSTNDIPMLSYTHESVAMGNSNPILFDLVTYKTDDIKNDGIEKALKHFNIID